MSMKPPANEPQGSVGANLATPPPKDVGEFPSEQNLVSSMKPKEGVHVASNLVATCCETTTQKPG